MSDGDSWFDQDGVCLLFYAACSNQESVVVELLKHLKQDFSGDEYVTLLLDAGADPYIENEMGLNSFDISEKFGPFPSVIKALEEHGERD